MSNRDAYLHDVTFEERLSPEDIGAAIHTEPDNEAVEAVMQLLQNEAARYQDEAHDHIAAGHDGAGKLALGGAQALKSVFFMIVDARQGRKEGS